MRLVTFTRKNQQRVGLMGPQDQILDLAEVNRRYLKGGNAPFLASMQAFIESGGKALQVARKAEKYVAAKNPDEQKKTRRRRRLGETNPGQDHFADTDAAKELRHARH